MLIKALSKHGTNQRAGRRITLAGCPSVNLRRAFAWTLAGNIVLTGTQWVSVVVLAKVGSTEMVGHFALASAIATPITFLANMQLRVVYVTDTEQKYPIAQIVGLRLVLAVIAAALTICVCKLVGYGLYVTMLTLLVALAHLVDCISENIYAVMQRAERMDQIAISQMLRGILSALGLGIVVFITRDILCGAVSLVSARLLILVLYDASRRELTTVAPCCSVSAHKIGGLYPEWNVQNQLRMLWAALPLGVVAGLNTLIGNMPRYAIERYLGPYDLGIYSAISYFPAAAMMLATAVGYASFASLARHYGIGDIRGFRSLLVRSGAVCLSIGIIGVLVSLECGGWVLGIVYRPDYAQHWKLLTLLMAVGSVGCLTSYLGCAMSATRAFRAQVPLFLVVLLVSSVSCFLLVPQIGLRGAALSALLAMIVQLCGIGIVVSRALKMLSRELQVQSVNRKPCPTATLPV
jgi:O-antigen/teichoic acid export membrane protein